eukprot:5700398-Pyramimonas_sp.AAC.1
MACVAANIRRQPEPRRPKLVHRAGTSSSESLLFSRGMVEQPLEDAFLDCKPGQEYLHAEFGSPPAGLGLGLFRWLGQGLCWAQGLRVGLRLPGPERGGGACHE